ncbi:hypothetical protein FACS1894145_6730 [Bacteroidia bacterium]|nr:hypothetical protein FACS1894145_6730 [Bacteroidia bacterium]
MEAVLFDVYIAQTEMENNREVFPDSARKADLLNAILQRHQINKADFDSSLVWYSDNLSKYIKVNEKIMARYVKMTEDLRNEESKNPEMLLAEESGSSYPVNNRVFFLSKENLPQNVYVFKADTALQEFGGTYNLRFNVLGLPSKSRPAVTFCIQCQDTTIVRRDSIRGNGFFTMTVGVPPMKKVNRLYGSIYFPETSSDMTLFINRFRISKK